MSNLSCFLAQNVVKEEIVKYVASKRFKEDGKLIEWEISCVTSEEDEAIRKSCTRKVQVPGKKNMFTPETDYDKYLGLLAVRCVKFPELNNAELQNSYNVMGADSLLKTMLKPGEYQDLLKKVQEINGFDTGMDELVEEAKN
ncbi:phage portal protein [Clostridium botulinum]|nr:phage portal protein [Clostridium botulinum]NFR13699.1 phage portal protein [Clostridium botulinum]NFR42234.1 phage portal protein [Clostridium botulinum]NFS50674.1 phage portal protein [Clostridium botulinum]